MPTPIFTINGKKYRESTQKEEKANKTGPCSVCAFRVVNTGCIEFDCNLRADTFAVEIKEGTA